MSRVAEGEATCTRWPQCRQFNYAPELNIPKLLYNLESVKLELHREPGAEQQRARSTCAEWPKSWTAAAFDSE